VDDKINTVVSSMEELSNTTIKAGIEFKGFTKKITQVAAGTDGASKSWTTFSRLVSGTPLWAFQNKLRAYLSILAGFENRSKENTAAAIKERKEIVDSIKAYANLTKEYEGMAEGLRKTTEATYNLSDSRHTLNKFLTEGPKDTDGKEILSEDRKKVEVVKSLQALQKKGHLATTKYNKLTIEINKTAKKLKIAKKLEDKRAKRRFKRELHHAKLKRTIAAREIKSFDRTVALVGKLDDAHIKGIKNTLEYHQTLLATNDEDLAIRRGVMAVDKKKKLLDEEHDARVKNAKRAYALDEERVAIAIRNAEKIAKHQGKNKFQTFKMKRNAKKGTRKQMEGEMNEFASEDMSGALDNVAKNMRGSIGNLFPLLAPIGAVFKVVKLGFAGITLRSMTAAKFRIVMAAFITALAPILKMLMLYLIYAILFIIAMAVVFKFIKNFYDILERFGVIEDIKQLGKDAFSIIKTFFKAFQSFFGGDYEQGLDYVLKGGRKLGKFLLKVGKVALKVGFLALVTAFGMLMKFIVALKNDPDIQKKLLEVLMYVGLIIVGAIALQLFAAAALAALSFLLLPALIIVGIVAALFAFQYYFGEELNSFKDYFMAAIDPISKVLLGLASFVSDLPILLDLLIDGAIKQVSKFFDFELPTFNLPKFANGGTSRGGMALVGERGPELVNLSKGSKVFSNTQSKSMLSSGTVNNFNITINAKDTSKAEMRRIATELGTMINTKMNRTGATRTMR
tara:strand:+ start:209 stop:2419 length:2211 start_codon:yes stop_codon:yes gene_type:complete